MADGNKLKYPWALLNLYAEVHTLTLKLPNSQELSQSLADTTGSPVICSEIRFFSGLMWNTIWLSYTSPYKQPDPNLYPITSQSLAPNDEVPPFLLLLPRNVLYTCLPFIKHVFVFKLKHKHRKMEVALLEINRVRLQAG